MPIEALWGDVNHDGNVSISDITLIVDYILGNSNIVVFEEADLNQDGIVSIADITLLVDHILGM